VDGLDLSVMALAFGSAESDGGEGRWDPSADLNDDGLVDGRQRALQPWQVVDQPGDTATHSGCWTRDVDEPDVVKPSHELVRRKASITEVGVARNDHERSGIVGHPLT
jgi:hypothetical protein